MYYRISFIKLLQCKKAFFFIGKPHSGKSTLLEVIGELIGVNNCSNIPLHKLSERFTTACLFNKKINICGELDDVSLGSLDTFKKITGNDKLFAERKGQDGFSFISKAKLLFAGNELPNLRNIDTTSAFFDRLLILKFNYTVSTNQIDYNLKQKLLLERDYILRWCIEGINKLLSDNFVFPNFNESDEYKKNYEVSQNNMDDFISDHCILGVHKKIYSKALYAGYIKYCDENCFYPLSRNKFLSSLEKYPVIRKKLRIDNFPLRWGYEGIDILHDQIE